MPALDATGSLALKSIAPIPAALFTYMRKVRTGTIAGDYLMTASARSNSDCGIVRPSTRAASTTSAHSRVDVWNERMTLRQRPPRVKALRRDS